MRNHHTPLCGERVFGSLNGFREGTDLIDFKEQSIGRLCLDCLLNEARVGDRQIIARNSEIDVSHTQPTQEYYRELTLRFGNPRPCRNNSTLPSRPPQRDLRC